MYSIYSAAQRHANNMNAFWTRSKLIPNSFERRRYQSAKCAVQKGMRLQSCWLHSIRIKLCVQLYTYFWFILCIPVFHDSSSKFHDNNPALSVLKSIAVLSRNCNETEHYAHLDWVGHYFLTCVGFDDEDMEKPHLSVPACSASVPLLLSAVDTSPVVQVSECRVVADCI